MKGNSACDEFAAATRAASTSKQVGALPLMGSKAKSANAIAVPAPCRRHGMDSKRDLSLSGCKVNCKVVKLHAVTACRRRSTRCHSVHADSVLSNCTDGAGCAHACRSSSCRRRFESGLRYEISANRRLVCSVHVYDGQGSLTSFR